MAHHLKHSRRAFCRSAQCSVLRPLPALLLIHSHLPWPHHTHHSSLNTSGLWAFVSAPSVQPALPPGESCSPDTGHILLCDFPQTTLSSHLPSAFSTSRTGPSSRGRLTPQCPVSRHPRAPLNSHSEYPIKGACRGS